MKTNPASLSKAAMLRGSKRPIKSWFSDLPKTKNALSETEQNACQTKLIYDTKKKTMSLIYKFGMKDHEGNNE